MICQKCGKRLEDGCLFCTECGNRVDIPQNSTSSNASKKDPEIICKVNKLIEKLGDKNINAFLSVAAIIFMISIKLLGFIIVALLITAINSFLVYNNFKRNSKIDSKMIFFSLLVFLLGLVL